jgi:hypothetical protein
MDEKPNLASDIFMNAKRVRKLPKRAVKGQIIFNKADGFFYVGVNEKEVKDVSCMEETSI